MFYDVYCKLCKEMGVSPSRAAIEMGVNKAAVSYWKRNDMLPSGEVLDKASQYFGVSADYLLEKTTCRDVPADGERAVSDNDIRFALFGDNPDVTDDMLEDVKRYAQFLAERGKKKG